MTKVPYSLVVIKPLTVGRGQGFEILQKILENCPVALRMFRVWNICDTTLFALYNNKSATTAKYEAEAQVAIRRTPHWICVFTHIDRMTDPTTILGEYFGPDDPKEWLPKHLRYSYGGFTQIGPTAHVSDTVVHLATSERVNVEANLLFLNFDETLI